MTELSGTSANIIIYTISLIVAKKSLVIVRFEVKDVIEKKMK